MTTSIKLCIAMLLEGPPESASCRFAPQRALRRLRGLRERGDVHVLDEEFGELNGNVDVSRARDRFARVFLTEASLAAFTHMLWWDEDVLPEDLQIIARMLETGYDVVGAPYRRKQQKELYPYQLFGDDGVSSPIEIIKGCVPVHRLAFGFMLTSRKALQQMWDAYRLERWYIDPQPAQVDAAVGNRPAGAAEQVGMFDLLYTPIREGPDGRPWRTKLSEDYSWCDSYRAIGGTVQMYVGPGSPVGHIGSTVFRGSTTGLAAGHLA